MEENQKRIFNSLRFFANEEKARIQNIKNTNFNYYQSKVPTDIEKILYASKYISNKEAECLDPLYMITPTGDAFLRDLQKIYYKDWKFWIAILTAIATLGRLFGWW